ncbi:hypothetical protein [Rudaea sp.]
MERWVARQHVSSLFVTTVTQAEILHGLALLPVGRKRNKLGASIDGLFD